MIRLSHTVRAAAVIGLPAALAAQNPKTQPVTHKPEPTSAPITAADLKTRLYIYAADSMEGRETGTRGHIKATNYIAAQLKALGLKPMGDNGTYFQNVPVIRRALDPSSTITADGVTLHAGTDFLAQAGRGRVVANSFPSGPVIYAGTMGDSTPLISSEQAAGKIVLYRQAAGGRGGRGGRGGGGGGFGRGGGPAINGAAAVIPIGDAITPQQSANALHPREGQVQLKWTEGSLRAQ